MSDMIDDEIVRMQFDNGQFEKNVSESMSTLDKLKEKLNFKGVADSSEEELKRAANATERLAEKFENLHTVIGKTVDKIKDDLANAIERTLKGFTVDNVTAGWSKYAEKSSAVATLVSQGYELERVNKELEKLNWFTDETSYNFTDMIGNINKFTAAGQSLEEANIAMQGIANWAALSGQNATKASMAMYQLSQAMGKGALKYDDYKSIQNAGMDTMEFRKQAIAAAEALGTLRQTADGVWTVVDDAGKVLEGHEVTLSNFTSDLSTTMWFTSDVMMQTFSKYGSAVEELKELADESGKAGWEVLEDVELSNKALEDAFSTTSGLEGDALKNKLLYFKEQYKINDRIVQNLADSTDLQNEITEQQIAEEMKRANSDHETAKATLAKALAEEQLEKRRTDAIKEYASTYKTTEEDARIALEKYSAYIDEFGIKAFKAGQECRTFADVTDSIKDAVSTTWMQIFELIFGNYEQAKEVWSGLYDFLESMFISPLKVLKEAFAEWNAEGGREVLMQAFGTFGESFLVISHNIGKAFNAAFGTLDGNAIAGVVNKITVVADAFYSIIDILTKSRSFTAIIALIESASNAIGGLFEVIGSNMDSIFGSAFDLFNNWLSTLILGITNIGQWTIGNWMVVEKLKTALDAIIKAVTAIVNVANVLYKTAIQPLVNTLTNAFGGALANILLSISDFIVGISDIIVDICETIVELIGDGSKLKKIVDSIGRLVTNIFTFITKIVRSLSRGILRLLNSIFGFVNVDDVTSIFNAICDAIANVIDVIAGLFDADSFDSFFNMMSSIFSKIATMWKKLGEFLSPAVESAKDGLKELFGFFTSENESNVDKTTKKVDIFSAVLRGLGAALMFVKTCCKAVAEFFRGQWAKAMENEKFAAVVNGITYFFTDIIFPMIRNLGGLAKDILIELTQGRFDTLTMVLSEVSKVTNKLFVIMTQMGLGNLFKGIGKFSRNTAKTMQAVADILWEVSDFVEEGSKAVKRVSKSISKYLKAEAFKTFTEGLLNIGKLFIMIFATAAVISLLPSSFLNKMAGPLVAIAEFFGLILVIFTAMSKLASANWQGILSVAGLIISITTMLIGLGAVLAVFTIAFALGKEDALGAACGVVLAILGSLAAVVVVMSKTVKDTKKSGKVIKSYKYIGSAIRGIALAMAVVVGAIIKLADELDEKKNLGSVIAALLISFGIITALVLAIKGLATNNTKQLPSMWTFLGLAALILLGLIPLLNTVKDLAGDDNLKSTNWHAILKIALILGAVALVIGVTAKSLSSLTTSIKLSGITSSAIAIASLAGLILLISQTLIPAIGELNHQNNIAGMLVGILGIAVLVYELCAMVDTLSETVKNNGAKETLVGVAGIAIVIAALSALVWQLGEMKTSWDTALSAVGGLAILVIALAGAMAILAKTIQPTNVSSMAAGVLGMIVVMAGLVVMLNALRDLSGGADGIMGICAALSVLIVVMATAVGVLGMLPTAAVNMVLVATSFLIVAAAIWVLIEAFKELIGVLAAIGWIDINANVTGSTNVKKQSKSGSGLSSMSKKKKTVANGTVVNNKSAIKSQGEEAAKIYNAGFEEYTGSVQAESAYNKASSNIGDGLSNNLDIDLSNIEKQLSTVEANVNAGLSTDDFNGGLIDLGSTLTERIDSSLGNIDFSTAFSEGIENVNIDPDSTSKFISKTLENMAVDIENGDGTDGFSRIGNLLSTKIGGFFNFGGTGDGTLLGGITSGLTGAFESDEGKAAITGVADTFMGALYNSIKNNTFFGNILELIDDVKLGFEESDNADKAEERADNAKLLDKFYGSTFRKYNVSSNGEDLDKMLKLYTGGIATHMPTVEEIYAHDYGEERNAFLEQCFGDSKTLKKYFEDNGLDGTSLVRMINSMASDSLLGEWITEHDIEKIKAEFGKLADNGDLSRRVTQSIIDERKFKEESTKAITALGYNVNGFLVATQVKAKLAAENTKGTIVDKATAAFNAVKEMYDKLELNADLNITPVINVGKKTDDEVLAGLNALGSGGLSVGFGDTAKETQKVVTKVEYTHVPGGTMVPKVGEYTGYKKDIFDVATNVINSTIDALPDINVSLKMDSYTVLNKLTVDYKKIIKQGMGL